MAANSKPSASQKSKSSIFGLVRILEGENVKAYDDLTAQVSNAVKPSDVIERMLVRDVVVLTWEVLRWRRFRVSMVEIAMPDALERILERLMLSQPSETVGIDTPLPPSPANKLVKKWSAGNPAAIKRVNKILASANLTMDTVMNLAIEDVLGPIKRIDHFITNTEGYRNAILGEIDRRRSTFADALRNTVQNVDKSSKVIKSKPAAQRMKRK